MDIMDTDNHHADAALPPMSIVDGEEDNMGLSLNPDAQATITDFLDFTEYLPSDMNRSLTLIGNLDHNYYEANSKVEALSRMYGDLPTLDASKRPDSTKLRADISEKVNRTVHTRTLAQAEACRMFANVDRHYQKLLYIQSKLEGLFEAFPTAQEELAATTHSVSPQATRIPKITIRISGDHNVHKQSRVKRGPRITVPGEVLAPNEFDWDTYDSASDISDTPDEGRLTPQPVQRRQPSSSLKRIKLKVPKFRRLDKTPKTPRAPRPPGVMGTNVHSQVAGISTSNALAKLQPPPEGALIGSEHRPWGRLTQFELAKLRKRMKKNAVWQPSTTMINRELNQLERSFPHYKAAKVEAEATGQVFDGIWEPSGHILMHNGGAPVEEATDELEDLPIVNKGMKLNEQKRAKKESLAKMAAVEAEESARKMADAARVMRGLFDEVPANGQNHLSSKSVPETRTPSKAALRKRKRESTTEIEVVKAEVDVAKSVITPATPVVHAPAPNLSMSTNATTNVQIAKRTKIETPIPPPPSSAGSRIIPLSAMRTRATAELSPATEVSTSASTSTTTSNSASGQLRQPSPRKSSTPILPPTRERRKVNADSSKPTSITNVVLAPTLISSETHSCKSTTKSPTPAPEAAGQSILAPVPAPGQPFNYRPLSRGKAASAEPGSSWLGRDRPRRASTVHNTPAPDAPATRPPSRRTKRPAPGPLTAGEEGSASISVGRRTAAPRKKAAGRKGHKDETAAAAQDLEPDIEVDENGVAIDPDEPRYCVCNRVSYGEMIACENNQCQYEWFHLPCVGLTIETLPPRTTKWYCPDCRIALDIGEKGEVSARGRRK